MQGYNTKAQEYDIIHVNGDNNLENCCSYLHIATTGSLARRDGDGTWDSVKFAEKHILFLNSDKDIRCILVGMRSNGQGAPTNQ